MESIMPEHEQLKNSEIPVQIQPAGGDRKYRVVYRAPVPGISTMLNLYVQQYCAVLYVYDTF